LNKVYKDLLLVVVKEVKMEHGCRWVEGLLAVLILVFVIWPTQIFSYAVSWWIVVVSAALILIHSLFCRKCNGLFCGSKNSGSGRTARRRGSRRRRR